MSRPFGRPFSSLLGLLALSLALAGCGPDRGDVGPAAGQQDQSPTSTSTSAPAPTTTAPPGPGATELLALLEQARGSTFHARWVARQNDGDGGEVRFELWNRPPHGRLDVVIGSSGLSSSAVRNPSGAYRCARSGQEPWACQPGGEVEPAGVILDAVRDAVAGVELAVTDETVVGRPARCFTEVATGREAVCTTADGVPLRVLSGPQRIEILKLERTVGDADLEPPAGSGG
ncbi:MAG: hypothetical protein KY439_08030 [Actinobacteria bacterium]|nr:hypothetical protein [Actinomycetota bacterium]